MTVALAQPAAFDGAAVARMLPQGGTGIRVVDDGLDVTRSASHERHVTAAASVAVYPEPPAGWRLRP